MHITKSISQTASSARPVSISSNFKFEKVQKLTQIVQELEGGKRQTIASQSRGDNGMGEKVLQALKKRIKTSYDQLYKNYPENKNKILKQIQTVEGNISGENVMKNKQQEFIKEKAKYDKLKANIEEKQRKLKKLIDLKAQLSQNTGKEINNDVHQQNLQKLMEKKEECEHANSIASEMLKQRKEVLFTLQKRYSQLIDSIKQNKGKYEKCKQANIKRRQMIYRLQQALHQQPAVQIPNKLAEQLSSKLQQYENKYSYNNIIQHQAVIEEERLQRQKQEALAMREELRAEKNQREKEDRKELQNLQNIHSLNTMEQYKIMRLCGAQSIQGLLTNDFEQEKARLFQLQAQIEQQIRDIQDKTKELQVQIEKIISKDSSQLEKKPLETLENMLFQQQRSLKRKADDLQKQKQLGNHWGTIMHLINGNKIEPQSLAFIISTATASLHTASLQKSMTNGQFWQPYGYPEEGQSIDYQ